MLTEQKAKALDGMKTTTKHFDDLNNEYFIYRGEMKTIEQDKKDLEVCHLSANLEAEVNETKEHWLRNYKEFQKSTDIFWLLQDFEYSGALLKAIQPLPLYPKLSMLISNECKSLNIYLFQKKFDNWSFFF